VIALSDNQTVALISGGFAVLVALITGGLALLAKQNSDQHGSAQAERAQDREAAIEARRQFAEQLNFRLDDMHSDIQQTRDLLADHVSDHEAHGRGPRAA
jgi:hypothetical protein